ncbi:MAG: rod shape-determining protein MreC [Bacteroidales bacterium]|nr:rod shape-determining protein MreC [Bacteroidales bacterium]MDY2859614.1 rod shape-determining protein MreC [Candidatus Cryptobacteroides sp.]MDY5442820.1 rod shape-determining protein MreC [Candidatus Cryptobacteroides sp.]MDY5570282.1 rod shape-determining protein MreC [Candidatus Cryptobacteroides sp.]
MQRRRTITGTLINTAVFILLEIAALGMLRHGDSLQDLFISRAAHGFLGYFWGVSESISDYASLRTENRHLAEEILRLTETITRLEEEAAAAAACDSADYTTAWRGKYEFIPAEVIKNSVNKQHNYLIIGKGSDDGVRPQTGIITSRGVIGIVDAVSRHYSYAISFLNSDSSISARIGKDGAAGPMAWDGKGSGNALLREIPLQVKFEEGDTVYTSGFSTIFPPDIPIGRITGSRIVNGATFEIKVSLFQDFSSVRHVCLVRNRDLDEIMSLEKGGAEQ